MSTVLHGLIWLVSLIPRAEGPLPDRVWPSLPCTLAGVGSLIGRIVRPGAAVAERDQFVRRWTVWLSLGGIAIYVLVYAYQLTSTR